MLERLEDRTVPSSVSGLAPAYGSDAGGGAIVVSGSGFSHASALTFGGVSASYYFVMSDTMIMATTPVHATGVVDVVVTAPSGTSPITSADQYTYFPPPTTTNLISSADPSTFGQSVTLTATVSNGGHGTPTGTVEFDDGGNFLGTGTLSLSGQATFVTSALTVGAHPITAIYYGDSANAGSTSMAWTQTVQLASTTTTLTSSANPADPGQAVTFTAQVVGQAGGAPTGIVTFKSGTTTLGTGTLSPGGQGAQATFTISTLMAGTDPITAVYGGDANYTGSTSSTLNQVVQDSGAFVWTGDISTDWNVAGNWLVDGATATAAPGQTADVIFGGAGESNINSTTDGPVTIHSITIGPSYTGSIDLVNGLDILGGGFDMEGGSIDQPNGVGVSDIIVSGGSFNWGAGIMNTSANLGEVYTQDVMFNIEGANQTTGSTFAVSPTTVNLNLTGSWTFNNNAGISIGNSTLFDWQSGNIATTGVGLFHNTGAQILMTNAGTTTCDLPYVSDNGGDCVVDFVIKDDRAAVGVLELVWVDFQ